MTGRNSSDETYRELFRRGGRELREFRLQGCQDEHQAREKEPDAYVRVSGSSEDSDADYITDDNTISDALTWKTG